jgi:hypothetical protein
MKILVQRNKYLGSGDACSNKKKVDNLLKKNCLPFLFSASLVAEISMTEIKDLVGGSELLKFLESKH